jgi:hypothetical protein
VKSLAQRATTGGQNGAAAFTRLRLIWWRQTLPTGNPGDARECRAGQRWGISKWTWQHFTRKFREINNGAKGRQGQVSKV